MRPSASIDSLYALQITDATFDLNTVAGSPRYEAGASSHRSIDSLNIQQHVESDAFGVFASISRALANGQIL